MKFEAHLTILVQVLVVYLQRCLSDGQVRVGTVIGIDLGTAYSSVAVFENGRPNIIANGQGNRATPSYVAFTDECELLVGEAAKSQLTTNPENTVFNVKRLIGREWDDGFVEADVKWFPFKVIKRRSRPYIEIACSHNYFSHFSSWFGGEGVKTFAPEEISAMVLRHLKETAEEYLDEKVTHAVVTVPAYFNDAQRQATKDAAAIAGLSVLRIINEPTAAALAYGLHKGGVEQYVLVFDLGGGTFDVSVVVMDNGLFEVVATIGDTHLGGEDFDQRIIEYFLNLYQKKKGKDLRKDNVAVQKLRREVEKSKRTLSSAHETRLEIESFFDGEDFSETLTRAKFEELNADLFDLTMKLIDKILVDADIRKEEVDEIILVGGSCHIPKIRQLVQEFFDGKKLSGGVNPDEAVGLGAAVMAGIHSGESEPGDTVLLDVNPITLGIETEGGVMTKLIPRNTVLPIVKSRIFTTAADNQRSVSIKVFEGERPTTRHNILLGKFELESIPPAPRGIPQIKVQFELDTNGILKVSAEWGHGNMGTEQKKTVTVTDERLSSHELNVMRARAEDYVENERVKREKIEIEL